MRKQHVVVLSEPERARLHTLIGQGSPRPVLWFYQVAPGGQRRLPRAARAVAGGLPGRACGGGGLRQRGHPPRQARPALAGRSSPRGGAARGALQPHDNPVERTWAALKAWLANSPTLTIQGRVRQVHAFFRQRSPTDMLATAAPHSSPWLPDGYEQNLRQAALETEDGA